MRRYQARKSLHLARPDYTRPVFRFSEEQRQRILARLAFLYGWEEAAQWMPEVERISQVYFAHKPKEMIERERGFNPLERFTEEDVILITYGDILRGSDPSPLTTLSKFCGAHLQQGINTLHILPFYPYSSDRGFAVIDFESVDPHLGSWSDIEELETRYQLMFDGVINHVSSRNRWFHEFLNNHPHYRKYFVSFRAPEEIIPEHRSLIFRPRTSDVLTPFPALDGVRYVWTTFSPDQIDLNYRNPEVLIRVLEVLLSYVRRGADLLRLDAVTYLWRRPGTPCVHLPETHETIKLFRDVLGAVAPHVALVTETNVPHADNISYFGNGGDEAHLVYNFALPPLLLHTFYSEDSTQLTAWARKLEPPSETTGFLNFLDSHDGMGLLAVRDLLPKTAIQAMVQRAQEHGGLISYRTEGDGQEAPYEINITWFSALNREGTGETIQKQVDRFLASRAIAMCLRGVAGIYLHSLFGTRNDREAVIRSQVKRDINRRIMDLGAVEEAIANPDTSISKIFKGMCRLLEVRTRERAFHPRGAQQVMELDPRCFAFRRSSPEGDRSVLVLTNICNSPIHLSLGPEHWPSHGECFRELLSGDTFEIREGSLELQLEAYGILWLTREEAAPLT